MDDNKEFNYTYSAPSEKEKREVEFIRRQYEDKKTQGVEEKIIRLRKLHLQVKRPAMAISLTMGVVGVLVFGLGLTTILEWGHLVWGSLISIIGLAPIISAYWVNNLLLAKGKKKYGEEILRLSDEILNSNSADKPTSYEIER